MAQILLFGARWCPVTGPLAKALAREGIDAEVLDCERRPEEADRYGIVSLPTVVVLDGEGQEIRRFQGTFRPADVREVLRRDAKAEGAARGGPRRNK